jgi:hypothetical protein
MGSGLRVEPKRVEFGYPGRIVSQSKALKKEYSPITAEAQTQNIDEGVKPNVWKEPPKSTYPAALSVPVRREFKNKWGIPLARPVLSPLEVPSLPGYFATC